GSLPQRACLTFDNQFPSRIPSFFAPLTRRIPAASSGLSKPASAGSYANRRIAAIRTLIVRRRPVFAHDIVLYRPAFIDLECDEFIPQGISCLPVRSCFVKSVKRVGKTGENTMSRNRLAAEEIQLENTEDEMDLV